MSGMTAFAEKVEFVASVVKAGFVAFEENVFVAVE